MSLAVRGRCSHFLQFDFSKICKDTCKTFVMELFQNKFEEFRMHNPSKCETHLDFKEKR